MSLRVLTAALAIGGMSAGCRSISQPEVIRYHGREAVRLESGDAEAIIVPGLARVMAFGRRGGPGLVWENAAFEGQAADLTNRAWQNFGGAKLWVAPKSAWKWPPDLFIDRGPCAYAIGPGGAVEMRGMASPLAGVRLDRSIRPGRRSGQLELTYTMRNTTTSNVSWGIWNIVQAKGGGRILMPAPEGARVWEDENFPALRQWERVGDLLVLQHAGQEGKIASVGPEGWLAYEKEGEVWVLAFDADTGLSCPPGQGRIEVYTAADYVELEHVGPLVSLAPGGQTAIRERWILFSLNGARLTPELLAARIREAVRR